MKLLNYQGREIKTFAALDVLSGETAANRPVLDLSQT